MINKVQKKPFFIAEISANHCGSILIAKKLIKCAKANGADAVKLQTYTADTMTIKSSSEIFKIKTGVWKNYTLWDLYNEAHTPLKWHKELFYYAKKIGIKIFSTPFDETSVDFLEKLNCPLYKVSSFEMTDLPLIEKIAKTKKPIIISTGMASIDEIEETFVVAKKYGSGDITLLYCVSNYPSKNSDFNLNNINILKNKFDCKVGLSDHSKDIEIAKAAIAYENQTKGLDVEFSLKGKEIRLFRKAIDDTYSLLGKKYFYRSKEEQKNKIYRRSIFAVKNIKEGEKLTTANIKRIRPGNGIEPKYYNTILGKKSPFNIKAGSPIKKNLLLKLK